MPLIHGGFMQIVRLNPPLGFNSGKRPGNSVGITCKPMKLQNYFLCRNPFLKPALTPVAAMGGASRVRAVDHGFSDTLSSFSITASDQARTTGASSPNSTTNL